MRHRTQIEAFLDSPPPVGTYALTFSHNDLGIEHVLVAPRAGAITGIIDWGDAAPADPAYDFGRLRRDLAPAAVDAALLGYGADAGDLRDRAVFYARCAVIEDLDHGLSTGREIHVSTSLAELDCLFRE